MSKVGVGKSFEKFEIMGEGGKTFLGRTKIKELIENEREFKSVITHFRSLIFMSLQRRVECGISTSLTTISSLSFLSISTSFLLNSSSLVFFIIFSLFLLILFSQLRLYLSFLFVSNFFFKFFSFLLLSLFLECSFSFFPQVYVTSLLY